MFDYKQEINKYQPLPEPKQAQSIIENNDVEDIIDILKKLYFRTNKE